MALQIASLNSGSNGNCYYVGNHTDAVLIDIGISCRETEKRMKQLGLNVKTVKAVFISHEHTDHIKGVSTFVNKYNLPVYITGKTAVHGPKLIKHLSKSFTAGEPVTVGELMIIPFTKKHDAADPHSFIVNYQGISVGVLTDIGIVCDDVIRYFKQCNAVFLESNFDEMMLEKGKYPVHLKNRIRGGLGHISNMQALQLFIDHRPPFMSHLILSHLSKENNSPELAVELFKQHANGTHVSVASRYGASEVFTITRPMQSEKNSLHPLKKTKQLDLFE